MQKKSIWVAVALLSALSLLHGGSRPLAAQGAAALAGAVTSKEEGKMEGVVVSARREGANFTVSVVSDKAGKYSFPRTHLEPGAYKVTIRAVGYDLVSSAPVTVTAGKTTTADLTLEKTKNLGAQLSSIEWVTSMGGTPEQKDKIVHQLLACNYCHTYQRIAASKHSNEQFLRVIDRMVHYYADGSAVSNDNKRGRAARVQEPGRQMLETSPNWGASPGMPRTEVADFFAMNNLSGGKTTWAYELKTLPRPTGKATQVIVTEYDIPTASTATHDSAIDAKGVVWFTDESAQYLGSFDTKTATFKEYKMPPVPAGVIPGTRDVIADKDGMIWFPMRNEKGVSILTRFDPKTEQITPVEGVGSQFISEGPDGKIWAGWRRVDPKTLKVDGNFNPQAVEGSPVPKGAFGYAGNTEIDSKGNPWMMTQAGPGGVMGFDIAAKQPKWYAVDGLMGRRGAIDREDRLWYGEYRADKIAMVDTKTGKAQRWDLRPYSGPYTASKPDSKGRVYAPSNMAERLFRLDPKTNEIIEYQMPTEFDTKKINYDPTTSKTVLWFANMRTARITRVEPLD